MPWTARVISGLTVLSPPPESPHMGTTVTLRWPWSIGRRMVGIFGGEFRWRSLTKP